MKQHIIGNTELLLELQEANTLTEWIKILSAHKIDGVEDRHQLIVFSPDDEMLYLYLDTYRLETDEEEAIREKNEDMMEVYRKERRYQQYLELKKEFEDDKTDSAI